MLQCFNLLAGLHHHPLLLEEVTPLLAVEQRVVLEGVHKPCIRAGALARVWRYLEAFLSLDMFDALLSHCTALATKARRFFCRCVSAAAAAVANTNAALQDF